MKSIFVKKRSCNLKQHRFVLLASVTITSDLDIIWVRNFLKLLVRDVIKDNPSSSHYL